MPVEILRQPNDSLNIPVEGVPPLLLEAKHYGTVFFKRKKTEINFIFLTWLNILEIGNHHLLTNLSYLVDFYLEILSFTKLPTKLCDQQEA